MSLMGRESMAPGADRQWHGVLATPVPEPSTLVLLAIGTAGAVGSAWRRRRKQVSFPNSNFCSPTTHAVLDNGRFVT
jgi:hypothetical protein